MENLTEINQLLNETHTISASYKRVAEATGENFNIFSILRMESDEVATHSRFIAELLNRKGSHGQKDKFLRNFIDFFGPGLVFNSSRSEVFVEYHIGKVSEESGGRLDIIIKDDTGNTIMIENKIYASEQQNQLLRYYNAYPNGKLFFLTLDGSCSVQDTSTFECSNISYHTDIVNWLEECKKDSVNAPILREMLSQYINLIKKLTNQNLNKKMSQDIVERILRDKMSLDAFKVLSAAQSDVKKQLLESVIQQLKNLCEKKGFTQIQVMEPDKDQNRLIRFQNDMLAKHNLRFALNFEGTNYSNLIFGFVNFSDQQTKDKELLALLRQSFPKMKQSGWWNAYAYYEGYRDWNLATLGRLYFDKEDLFLKDLENKIDTMLAILADRDSQLVL